MLEIFQFDFMIRAFIAGIIIGIVAPMIGVFLVVRRYSLMADTLAHVSLVGVAIGLLIRVNPVFTSAIVAVAAAMGIDKLSENKKLFGESVLALFLSGSLAIAVVIISATRGFTVDLFSFLFGSIATVATVDLYFIVPFGLLVMLTVVMLYKELFFVSFDPEVASSYGTSVKTYNLILAILAAVTISLSMRIVGILLIGALTVIPVLTAMYLSRSFKQTLGIAVVVSLFSVIAGLFLSFYFNLASGATIVVVVLVFFGLSVLFSSK